MQPLSLAFCSSSGFLHKCMKSSRRVPARERSTSSATTACSCSNLEEAMLSATASRISLTLGASGSQALLRGTGGRSVLSALDASSEISSMSLARSTKAAGSKVRTTSQNPLQHLMYSASISGTCETRSAACCKFGTTRLQSCNKPSASMPDISLSVACSLSRRTCVTIALNFCWTMSDLFALKLFSCLLRPTICCKSCLWSRTRRTSIKL
mmetsp:Transcript_12617/g.29959  ORF Transcript_12617/g.29959 Transcript_12617/m.29959 type:complete len:211 (+) Transcript_12617:2881-3513(+)